jgi:hypothetical protein
MGAQFLLEMRARRSRRVRSISAMYPASTIVSVGLLGLFFVELVAVGEKQGSSYALPLLGGNEEKEGRIESSVEKAKDVSRAEQTCRGAATEDCGRFCHIRSG